MNKSPNLLAESFQNLTGRLASKWAIFGYLGYGLLFILAWQFSLKLAAILAIAAIVVFFAARLDLGIYLLAAVSFFIGWIIDFSRYEWARDVAYLRNLNAPVVDFVAVILMLSLALGLFFYLWPERSKRFFRYALPSIHWYGLFILAAGLSALSAYDFNQLASLKYLARSLIFVYIAFIAIPQIIIQDKRVLRKVFEIWIAAGVLIAVFGLSSLIFAAQEAWYRVVPYNIFGSFAPLGFNHNVLAESLVAIIPLALYFFSNTREKDKRMWYGIGAGLMILAMLLTLSRAAWLSFLIQLIVIGFFSRHRVFAWLKEWRYRSFIWILLAPIILYMFFFLSTSTVVSSNVNRIEATRIALFYTARAPLLGYGPGMFIPVLSDTAVYTLDFGDPQDAHGFVQKILLEEGVLGLFFFLGFLFWVLRAIWRARQSAEGGAGFFIYLFAMVLGVIVFQLFNTSYFNSHLWLPIGLALTAVRIHTGKLFYEPKK